ncbi:hemerythrin domain-containing protein [Draconibacterium sp. IB214405]|uniref:hemerythrin domain-containing protein n=1 Tax=Draconibacterium sp. IB214405 TaxID=3097352 RepID=UPI002A149983|nr:hemerythrin domain-containing protein [Draconibacterium sp. IB214405]MDX8338968.1 hemerythrin domain-containing protein [Draconibacterium sp. IB214405]
MGSKQEEIQKTIKMSKLLFSHPQLILVLERFGIKLGVREKTVEDICREYEISTKVFLMVVNLNVNTSYHYELNFDAQDIKQIVKYLTKSHSYFADEVFPEIIKNIHLMSEYSQKPEMQLVERFFNEYKNEVDQHFDYENNTVFPYILNLIDANAAENYSVIDYREHHDDIQEKLDDVKKLLIEHLPQKADNNLRRKILFALFDLDTDLQTHSKIENEILIPQVEQLEKQGQA